MGIEACKTVELPVVENPLGNLAFAEGGRHLPFQIARTFFVYDVPAGAVRGGHAHRALEEAVFCLSGRLDVTVDDGVDRQTIALDDPRVGIYLPPLVWYDLTGFAADTAYLVMASAPYDESDYIRDREEFLAAVGAAGRGFR